MADNSVEIRAVVKRQGAITAVDRLSLEIRKGEFFSILGPSGSGKTTILRLLAGFERPDAGEILIEGRLMEGVPPNQRPVNIVFQSYALFPHLTVAGNVAFGLEMQRLPRAEIESRVAEAIEMVKLIPQRERLPAQLSGGEQQRVALARALVNRPAVLLLDEPLGALDQQLRQAMQAELKAIQERVRLTFVFVTHHQEEALTMSDRVAVVHRGRVLQVGTPREIYESPANVFVAQFIGVSNTLTGRVISVENGRCTMSTSELPALPAVVARAPVGVAPGSRVTLVLRPERLHLSREVRPDAVPARIAKAVYNGNETQYQLRLSETLVWQARVSNTDADQPRFLPGESVYVRWKTDEGALVAE